MCFREFKRLEVDILEEPVCSLIVIKRRVLKSNEQSFAFLDVKLSQSSLKPPESMLSAKFTTVDKISYITLLSLI